MRPLQGWPTLALLVALGAGEVWAVNYYVSPAGRDDWSGRQPEAAGDDGPFLTLGKAAAVAQPGDVVHLREGIYREVLRPARSGEPDQPITFRNYLDEAAVISGADPLTGWRQADGGVWVTAMGWDLGDTHQLLAAGEPLTEARWPNSNSLFQPRRGRITGGTETTIIDPELPVGDWTGALLWIASGAEWICQSVTVTGHDPATGTLTFEPAISGRFYSPRKGNFYALMGARAALDAPGEWWFDRERGEVHLIPPRGTDPNAIGTEARRRGECIDLRDRRHIHLIGLSFYAGSLQMDEKSRGNLLDRLRGRYTGHSYRKDISWSGSVTVDGVGHIVRNCHFAHASGTLLRIMGSDSVVVNNLVEGGNYGGKWNGTVKLAGRRHLFSHNTVRHSGRDLVSIHGLSESLIEHNDLSDAGWLTCDLGMTYGHNTDFGNTVIRYNHVHDNRAHSTTMGIYFDHCSHNVTVCHNVVWNVNGDPIRINNPSYYGLVFNNTCWETKATRTFDHSRRNDMYGCRYERNVLNAPITLPEHVALLANLILPTPRLFDAAARDFRLHEVEPGIGAEPFTVGHDFANPPELPAAWELPTYPWQNALFNAGFELGSIEGWSLVGGGEAVTSKGNGWGNNSAIAGSPFEPTGTSRFELQLSGGAAVTQTISGLTPGREHTLAGWLRAGAVGEVIELSIGGEGVAPVSARVETTTWTRPELTFTPTASAVTVTIRHLATAGGQVFADNLGLPRVP